jgi:hypothetical protein
MKRVRLIHWKAEEAPERAKRLAAAGYEADYELPSGPALLRALREVPPLAVVIDLSRLPSQGRDLALTLRQRKATRHVPLVFVGGDPQKVAQVQELLPDAVYTSWEQIGGVLERAITHPPQEPVAPRSAFAAYAGKPLVDKLGIRAHSVVALVNAPAGFAEILGELPEGAVLQQGTHDRRDLTIWFTRSREELQGEILAMAAWAEKSPLWIAWPKKASRMASDLSQQVVRETGLASGLVDYKICSIDATWSGLLFTQRK